MVRGEKRAGWQLEEGIAMDDQHSLSRYFRLESVNGITVVSFVDIQIAPDAKDLLYDLAQKQGHKKLVLNLGNIPAMSTFSLGILANLQQKVDAAGGRLKLCCLGPELKKLFAMMKFDQIFEIHETQEDAVRSF
jgi:anti-sigma B factor antagonist